MLTEVGLLNVDLGLFVGLRDDHLGGVFFGVGARLRQKLSHHALLLLELMALLLDRFLHLNDVTDDLVRVEAIELLDSNSDLSDFL